MLLQEVLVYLQEKYIHRTCIDNSDQQDLLLVVLELIQEKHIRWT